MFVDYFYPPQPTRLWPQSSLFKKLNDNPLWDAELKYNGWRCLIFKENNKIYIYNRHGTIININSKLFLSHFINIPNYTIFDSELLNFRTKDLKNTIVIFDCPFYDNTDLRRKTLKIRRQYLDAFKMVPKTLRQYKKSKIYRIQQFATGFERLYKFTLDSQIVEGVVIKHIDSLYPTHPSKGKETIDWLKIKKIGDHAKV